MAKSTANGARLNPADIHAHFSALLEHEIANVCSCLTTHPRLDQNFYARRPFFVDPVPSANVA
jgi:hypothetical protein